MSHMGYKDRNPCLKLKQKFPHYLWRERLVDVTKKSLELIEKIYDTALKPELWPETSRVLAESLGFDKCGLAYTDPFKGNLVMQHMPGWEEKAIRSISEHFGSINPWVPWHIKNTKEGDVYFMEGMLRPEEYKKTEYYNDFLLPNRFSNGAGMCFSRRGLHLGILEFQRETSAPITSEEIHILKLLVPHLTRAFEITSRLWELNSDRDMAYAQLNRLNLGVILVDEQGRAVYLNRQAEELLQQNHGLKMSRNRLTATSVDHGATLDHLIQEAVKTGKGRGIHPGGRVLLENGFGNPPLNVLVTPMSMEGLVPGVEPSRFCAGVFISAPGEKIALPYEGLRMLYGLTQAESDIALKLAQGKSLDAIADEKGVTKATVRNQLKAVFHKTGTHRQNQLVNLLLTDPAAIVK